MFENLYGCVQKLVLKLMFNSINYN